LVHLSERRARDGAALEAAEQLIDRTAEVGQDALLDVRERARRDLILKSLEPGPKLLGQEIGHDAEELAHLDEEALELDYRALHAERVLAMRIGDAVVVPARAEKSAAETEGGVREDDLERREVRADEAVALHAGAIGGELLLGTYAHAARIGHHENKATRVP